ncbi:MAG TPA: polysaccharide deacetylase [Acidimicrobiia bacterium]|nr:polysaccharide deacetylase [Acidimicrobiia bacterium]
MSEQSAQYAWPDNYRSAVALSFDLDAESVILAVDRAYAERPSVMTHQAYGPITGLPRLLEILLEAGYRATFFIPGFTADRYPGAVAAVLEAGHEVGHHGYLHRPPAHLSVEEERAELERGLEALAKHGVRPAGFRAPWWEASRHTLGLLSEYGFVYDASLFDRDTPYTVTTAHGPIVEIPQSWALDDWERYAYMPDPPSGQGVIERPADVMETWWQEIVAYREYGGCAVPVMHPFLSGRPARAAALRELLERLRSLPDVWVATLGDVADHTVRLGMDPIPLDLPDLESF